MMIDPYNLDVCLGKPVEIFAVPANWSLQRLLEQLKLEKGGGGAALQLSTGQARSGLEKYPSSFLLEPVSATEFAVVGSLAYRYTECHDFALLCSEIRLIEVARSFAGHIMRYDPNERDARERYLKFVYERLKMRPSA